jgi:hypothetical protein
VSRVVERSRFQPSRAWRGAARFLWETLTFPFWLGSTLPPPALPGRQSRHTATRTPRLIRQLDDLRAALWRRRAAILAVRACWLALAVLDSWLAIRFFTHHQPAFRPFLVLAILLLIAGAALIAIARPARGQLARALDRSFGLRERVATAVESAEAPRLTGVRALQVIEATRVAEDVSDARVFQQRWPARELAMLALAALIWVALLIAGRLPHLRTGGPPQTSGQGNVPGLTEPDPRAGQTNQAGGNGTTGDQGRQGAAPGQSGKPSAQGQRDLDQLANALKDHATTRQAADDLQGGDYSGAASAMHDAGQSAAGLSPDARQGLADDLRGAAGQVSDPQLAQHLREAANALEQPGAAGAAGAFDKIASDINRIGQGQQGGQSDQGGDQGQTGNGQTGAGGGAGAGQPQLPSQQRSDPAYGQSTAPLGANGQPIELPHGNSNDPLITDQNGNNKGAGTTLPGAASAGGGQLKQGDVGESGADPNQVPDDQRGAVEKYFTPHPKE